MVPASGWTDRDLTCQSPVTVFCGCPFFSVKSPLVVCDAAMTVLPHHPGFSQMFFQREFKSGFFEDLLKTNEHLSCTHTLPCEVPSGLNFFHIKDSHEACSLTFLPRNSYCSVPVRFNFFRMQFQPQSGFPGSDSSKILPGDG